jgi:hypothetical protein
MSKSAASIGRIPRKAELIAAITPNSRRFREKTAAFGRKLDGGATKSTAR